MHVSAHGRDIAGLGLRLALEARSPSRVLAWGERARAGALRLRPVLPPPEGALAMILAELRRASAQVEEARLNEEPARGLERRVTTLEAQAQAHSRQTAGSWSAETAAVPHVAELAAELDDACLVELVDIAGRLHAVTVTGTRRRLHDLGPVAAVVRDTEALRLAVHRLATGPPAALADRARKSGRTAALSLDTKLLGPLRRATGDRSVVLVPTAALEGLPWAALPSLRGRETSVTPSAAVWLRASARTAVAQQGGVVAVAGPGLRAAEREVHEVASVREAAGTLIGAAATTQAVLDAMSRCDCAHIAAHGRLRADNPLLSSLDLADGPLTVYDLERLSRVPRIVLLPACQSGLAAVSAGDEVLGLAHALLALGSGAVVAAVVPVPDEATRPLMLAMHRELAAGAGVAAALATAQVEQDQDDPRSFAAAAGFVCFGAG